MLVDMKNNNEETIALMSSILSNKPLDAGDIQTIDDARNELRRIRKLMQSYHHVNSSNGITAATSTAAGKYEQPVAIKRVSLREEEHIDEYVKKSFPKNDSIRKLIYDALIPNALFEFLTEEELNEIVDVFEPCDFKAGDIVIKQGTLGESCFVVEKGELAITVLEDGIQKIVGYYSDACAFGELTLIHGSPVAASISCTVSCKLWCMKREWYRGLVGNHRQSLHEEKLKLLANVEVLDRHFKDVFEAVQLNTIAQLVELEFYSKGNVILREGEQGNTFYMIKSGEVKIFKKQLGEQPIATLGKQAYFGEKALLYDDIRQATVVACCDVTCYVLTRADFNRVMGPFKNILDGNVDRPSRRDVTIACRNKATYKIHDLKVINLLAQGTFGKVQLVKAKNTSKYYAVKLLHKDLILQNGRKDAVLNEYRIMMELSHPNILMMYCAMQDSCNIHFLLDLLPGGDLMSILNSKGEFSEEWVRFYSASVLLAFTELHDQRIAYRNLKPENLLLDKNGYCILIDFSLSKRCEGLTYTFCGTPVYIAPEIIRGIGHNHAVDYWALGVLLYELFTGKTPFQSYDPYSTAKKVLSCHIAFSNKFSAVMKDLIHALLALDQTRRLGCMQGGTEGVIKHRFYSGFDWDGLLKRKMKPPYLPNVPANYEQLGHADLHPVRAKQTNWFPEF